MRQLFSYRKPYEESYDHLLRAVLPSVAPLRIVLLRAVLIMGIIGVVMGGAGADSPPSLDNHQFYGNVYWDADMVEAPVRVEARVPGSTYSSIIADVRCNERVCSGTYGRSPNNILRVQGSSGLMVSFFLGDRQVKQVAYENNKVEELELNIATQPIECDADFICGEWSECGEEGQSRTCEDQNQCGTPEEWSRVEEKECGDESEPGGSGGSGSRRGPSTFSSLTEEMGEGGECVQSWSCSLYSLCVGNEQRRVCSRTDDCGDGEGAVVVPKPAESKMCVSVSSASSAQDSGSLGATIPSKVEPTETCFDGVMNQDEKGIDCGGPCRPCPERKPAVGSTPAKPGSSLLIFGVVALAVIILALVVFLIIHKKKVAQRGGAGGSGLSEDIAAQLDAAYSKGERSGMSRAEVTQKLIDRGWDMQTLEEYLMKR